MRKYKSQTVSAALALLTILAVLSSCVKEKPLPVFGEREMQNGDTVFHTIADFRFINQDGQAVTPETFKDKIYVADFFFTTCRTICPIMKTQMKRVYDAVENDPEVLILSHTIDPEYDTVELLNNFARKLGVRSNKWHFVTGNKDSIYNIAQKSYFSTAMEAKSEPDGFIHSGAFLLIDKERRIRGKYDGTKEEEVNRLLADIEKLKKEYEG
jgi:protein SCO1